MYWQFCLNLFILLWTTSTSSQHRYLDKHSSNGEIIKHKFYSLSYLESHEQAEWVTYYLYPDFLKGNAFRKNNFRPDLKIQSKSADSRDYAKSGYDRGHLVPAGDMIYSTESMSESFLYSNIAPQRPSFNRGIWKNLESRVREWGKSFEIIVVTGGLLNDGNLEKIGPNNVSVPKEFFKIIYAPKENEMIGFILPNQKVLDGIWNYVMTVDEIEEITCIDFFIELDENIESSLEGKFDIKKWQ